MVIRTRSLSRLTSWWALRMESASQHSSVSPISAFPAAITTVDGGETKTHRAVGCRWTSGDTDHWFQSRRDGRTTCCMLFILRQALKGSRVFLWIEKVSRANCHLSVSLSASLSLSPSLSLLVCGKRWAARWFLPPPNNYLDSQVSTFFRFLTSFELFYRNSAAVQNNSPRNSVFEEGVYVSTL